MKEIKSRFTGKRNFKQTRMTPVMLRTLYFSQYCSVVGLVLLAMLLAWLSAVFSVLLTVHGRGVVNLLSAVLSAVVAVLSSALLSAVLVAVCLA